MRDPATRFIQQGIAQRLPTLQEIRAEKCRRHLLPFIEEAWQWFEPGVPFANGWHIQAICEHLEALFRREIRRLVINIPPRTCKSSISSVLFPAWAWLNRPNFSMMGVSYEYGLAARDSLRMRRLFDTEFYRALNIGPDGQPLFRLRDGSSSELARLKDSEAYVENDHGGHRIAAGIEGAIMGKGAELLAQDDPMKSEQARSKAERERILRWVNETFASRFNDRKTGLWLVTMQRLHVQDSTGYELANHPDTVHLKLPMEFDARQRCCTMLGLKKWEDPRKENGELLWPARIGEQEVVELKRSGPYVWAGQYQQEPIPEGAGIFKVEKFKTWPSEDAPSLPIFDICAISVDAAFDDAESSSYVVIQLWGFKGPDAYLLEQDRDHMDFTATEARIMRMRKYAFTRKLPLSAIVVERKANGYAIINRLVKKIPGVIGIAPRESKESRAAAVSPFVHAGNVYVPKQAPWIADFLSEVALFPRYGSDDQVDAMTQILWWRNLMDVDVEREQKKQKFLKWAGVKVPQPFGTPFKAPDNQDN